MSRRHKLPQGRRQNPAYRQAFERLDEALAENTPSDNAEQLAAIGRHMFGDLWDDSKPSGTEDIPT